jgi:hypothetical protein
LLTILLISKPFQARLKYQELYYRYRQKVDLLMALKQNPDEELPDEAVVLSDFFAFLRAGGIGRNKEDQVLIVANSVDLLPFLHQKASPHDVAMIAGGLSSDMFRIFRLLLAVAEPHHCRFGSKTPD